jgi:hypothetical protein
MEKINLVIAVGSVDGICTASAVLRHLAPEAEVIFTQAFKVDQILLSQWEENRRILFVDLAVNNRDGQMTVGFLKKIIAAGHEIVGILDEHNAEDWQEAFKKADLDFSALAIKPVSQDQCDIKSSGALFLSLFPEADDHTKELCIAADCGDKMDFSTKFGNIVNAAVKSNIADDSRRIYLAKHFAQNTDSDFTISGWMGEYQTIIENHDEIIVKRIELGNQMVKIDTVGKTVDMTGLMKTMYDLGYQVVITTGEMYDKTLGKKTVQLAFGCSPSVKLDMVTLLKSRGITASGFSGKANVPVEEEIEAIGVVRDALDDLVWDELEAIKKELEAIKKEVQDLKKLLMEETEEKTC